MGSKIKSSEKARDTEVDAYAFIREELKELNWDCRNPSRVPAGQVWTQNQCLSNPDIRLWLDKKRPENIVKVGPSDLWVIEAKQKRTEIDTALDEAENYYAARLNKSKLWHVSFVSGVAGNDVDGYVIRNRFQENGVYTPILLNDKEMTGLISLDTARRMLSAGSANLKDIIIDPAFFMRKADRINEILHIGAIPINERAKVMAALLLSTLEGDLPDLNAAPIVLVKNINARAENALATEGKPGFADYVRLSLPTTLDNHVKFKKAIVETLKELYNLNIKSAMNSGTDVLGQFYEVFLKYGNWAEKMGIVLTPRHVTRFAAEVLDVGLNDVVLDPTCGTGGFLVGAFDYVKSTAQKPQLDQFKRNNIYGIDQQASLAVLAILNMIFRGDGKNHIVDGDCFAKWVTGTRVNSHVSVPARYSSKAPSSELNVVTKTLMNPPFHIELSDEKEYKFVQHALDQMVDGGLLFSILPMAAMYEQSDEKEWRENQLLKKNTLLSVISLSPELFYPIMVGPIAIIVKKGIPQPASQNVLWVRAAHDGLVKVKGKRLPDRREPNDLKTVLATVKAFVHNPNFPVDTIPAFVKACPIDYNDPLLELVPEAHLESQLTTEADVRKAVDGLTRETVAYMIRAGKSGSELEQEQRDKKEVRFASIPISKLFDVVRGEGKYRSDLELGDTPLVSATAWDNGVLDHVNLPPTFRAPAITIERVGGHAFVQLEDFATVPDDLSVLLPKDSKMPLSLYFLAAATLNAENWKFSYSRKLTKSRLKRIVMKLPMDDDESIDYKECEQLLKGCTGWDEIMSKYANLPRENADRLEAHIGG